MHNGVTYVCAWVSDESLISSRFTPEGNVAHTTETRADKAFCVSGVVSAALSVEPIARRTRRIGRLVRATRPLRPLTVTKHLGQFARIPTPAVVQMEWEASHSGHRRTGIVYQAVRDDRA